MQDSQVITTGCIKLLKQLISIPSLSKEEDQTASALADFLKKESIFFEKIGNNLVAYAREFNPTQPTLWLNSHHDTVKPNKAYTKDPFCPIEEDGKLFGLGSNDAGGPLVSLLGAFLFLRSENLPFNLLWIASAEEEISGQNGISQVVSQLPPATLAIVGEPTQMKVAVAEKGLLVVDGEVTGKPGHAARNEGINAIYLALEELKTIRDFTFKKQSPFLGESKVTATILQSGSQHNVIPEKCHFTLDVRVTDAYALEEALAELQAVVKTPLIPRSLRLRSSKTPEDHLIIKAIDQLGLEKYGSPTLSDQALIPYPSIKLGPGDSARSHSADEYIYLYEIEAGIQGYVKLISTYASTINALKS